MLTAALLLGLASALNALEPGLAPADSAKASQRAVAVVELFTSEGCSSCPPADQLLSDLIKEHAAKGNLIALSFHVDYWDRLGWKDPWSSTEATARQQQYTASFGNGSLYTPQMIVNGTREFVGSDRAKAKAEIERTLAHQPELILLQSAQWETKQPGLLRVRVGTRDVTNEKAAQVHDQAFLTIAITESGLQSNVKRGENAGRMLAHDGVVRVFTSSKLDRNGVAEVTIKVPGDVNVANASIVSFAQNGPGSSMLGAISSPLPTRLPEPGLKGGHE